MCLCVVCFCLNVILFSCVVAKGERVQGPGGRPQQEVKERSPVSAPDTERRLCHPGGGQGRPGGVWRGEFNDHNSIHAFLYTQRQRIDFTNADLPLLSPSHFPLFLFSLTPSLPPLSPLHLVFLFTSRTCCTQSFRTARLWRRTHLMKSETMLSSKRVSLKSCCTERSTTEPPPTTLHPNPQNNPSTP